VQIVRLYAQIYVNSTVVHIKIVDIQQGFQFPITNNS